MIDRAVAEHEAHHAAMGIVSGLEISAVDAIGDGATCLGQVRYYKSGDDQRRAVLMTLLAAGDVPPGWPPNGSASIDDLVHARRLIGELNLDSMQYYGLKVRTEELMDTPQYKSLQSMISGALMGLGRLNERDLRDIRRRWEWDISG